MDQVQNLQRYIDEYRRKKNSNVEKPVKIITVASGKGGVGKTNFSVNLAIALKQLGNNVVVFDADLGMANVDVIIGVVPKLNLYDVIFDKKEIEDIIINGPGGIRIIPGGSGVESLSNLNDLQRKNLSSKFSQLKDTDILIIDTGAGMSKNVLGFMVVADEIIIVATPEPTAITDAYSLIKVAIKYAKNRSFNVVINRAGDEKEAEIAFKKLGSTAKSFLGKEMNYLGYLADDAKVRKAVMEQVPFKVKYPMCPASQCIDRIAASLNGIPAQNKKAGGIKSFFSKVTYLLGRMD